MAKQTAFLQRRGDTFSFRIAIPHDLRFLIRRREIVRTLHTTDKHIAVPHALACASDAKRLFHELRIAVTTSDNAKLLKLLQDRKLQSVVKDYQDEHTEAVDALRKQHARDLEGARTAGRAEGLSEAISLGAAAHGTSKSTAMVGRDDEPPKSKAPKLGKVIKEYLSTYNRAKKAAMFKKVESVLPLFLEIVGDRPVDEIKQAHINEFFALIQKLPPRWRDESRRTGLSAREMADKGYAKTLSPKTFEDTYAACVRLFLTACIKNWQDDGFPTTLTVKGAEFSGPSPAGESKQRSFSAAELRRLFEGPEVLGFGANVKTMHKYWLPHLGLFTGARVNELCQLNPASDIATEDGIWHFIFTESGESAVGVKKSIKNATSKRKVPFHPVLVALGFQKYVEALRAKHCKQLFPEWAPKGGRASPNAEKWFSRFLQDVGLRDEKPGARLVGMHAFRHTLLSRANNLRVADATVITGHAGDASAVVRGYMDELELPRKQLILDQITYDVTFSPPGAQIYVGAH